MDALPKDSFGMGALESALHYQISSVKREAREKRCQRKCTKENPAIYTESRRKELDNLRKKALDIKKEAEKIKAKPDGTQSVKLSGWQVNPYSKANMHEIATYVSIMSRICGLPADSIPDCYVQEVLDIADKFEKLNVVVNNIDVQIKSIDEASEGSKLVPIDKITLIDAILMYFSTDETNKLNIKEGLITKFPTRASLNKEVFFHISLGTMFKIYNTMVKQSKVENCTVESATSATDVPDMDMLDFSNDDMVGGGAISLQKTDKKVMAVAKSKGIVKEVPVYKDNKNKKFVRRLFAVYVPLPEIKTETKLFLAAKKKRNFSKK